MTDLAIVCVRNEGAFLLDWLAHHRAVGFSRFLFLSNDCDDGTDEILDRLARMGHVEHHRNDGPHSARGIQFTALNRAATLDIVRRADWVLPLDIDEFVNIHVGDGCLDALRAALPEATAITLTWRLFGNGGHVQFDDRPVTRTFTRCAPSVLHWPWRAAMFKTLYRNDGTYRKPGVHRPRDPDPGRLREARWYDGEGRALEQEFRTRRIFSTYGRSNTALAQINHYPLGTMEDFVLKADRGRAVHSDETLGLDYWVERNWNTDEDRSILRHAEAADAIRTELLADAELSRLHHQAVAWRRARFRLLMQQDRYRDLFGRLLMTGPTRPLSLQAARLLAASAPRAPVG